MIYIIDLLIFSILTTTTGQPYLMPFLTLSLRLSPWLQSQGILLVYNNMQNKTELKRNALKYINL